MNPHVMAKQEKFGFFGLCYTSLSGGLFLSPRSCVGAASLEPDGKAGAGLARPSVPSAQYSTKKKDWCGCGQLPQEAPPFILQGQASHSFTCSAALSPLQGVGSTPAPPRSRGAQAAASSFAWCLFRPGKGRPDPRKNIHEGEKGFGCVRPTAPGTEAENGSLCPTAGAERAVGVGGLPALSRVRSTGEAV